MIWTVAYNQRPWTSNSARSASHWSQNANRTKQWRHAFQLLAQEKQIPALGPSRIIITPHLARGPYQDVGACFPAAKAAIDGLVDAGLWPDDTADHVVELIFRAPIRKSGDWLHLEIQPVTHTPNFRNWTPDENKATAELIKRATRIDVSRYEAL